MKQQFITILEKQFIETLISLLYAEPGFSDVDISDISRIMNVSKNTCKGILGSLVKKGLCYVIDDDDFSDIIYLDRCLYHLHPEWKHEVKNTKQVELILNEK
jgi:DNA-binding MarR family transcriptional regulator